MSFLATIDQKAADKKLRYLVIGGLAVNFYGYSRDTSDLDFFISHDDRVEWMNLLADFGYKDFHDGGSFIQYQAPEKSAWPVDLMLVQEKTFAPILGACVGADLFGVKTRVPSLEHLIVLKLHALKNTRTQRFLKDFLDVENLIRINQLDVKSKEVRELFNNTEHPICMKKYPDHSPKADELREAPLEFPVAPNFVSHPPRVELQTMLKRIEQNMPWRNSRPGEAERRLGEKIPVEFVL